MKARKGGGFMLSTSDMKTRAKEALRHNWMLAVGTGFVAFLFGASYYPNINYTICRQIENSTNDFFEPLQAFFVFLNTYSDAFWLWWFVILIIGGAASIGYARFNLSLVERRNPSFDQLFSEFVRLPRSIAMNLLLLLYILLWTLLLIIPGIIASLSYAMTPYIMAEDTEIGANEAITLSKEMMKGHKATLFYLYFSFIGWALLCALTLGIGCLWLSPYMSAAEANFYRDVSRDYWERNPDKSILWAKHRIDQTGTANDSNRANPFEN
jgi:uncharacterized membrane protein